MRWALASLKLRYPASANAYQLRSPVITSKLGADTIPGHTTWSKKSAFKFKEVSPSMQPELCRRYLHLRGPGLSLKCYIVERENKICIARPMADALRSRNSDTARRGSTITPTRVSPHADTPLRSLPTKSFASAWKVSFLREFGVT